MPGRYAKADAFVVAFDVVAVELTHSSNTTTGTTATAPRLASWPPMSRPRRDDPSRPQRLRW